MAKDDYYVIVCRILVYLYNCLKNGYDVDFEQISFETLNIKQSYYEYIIKHMIQDGYFEVCDIDNIMITPKGIEFLEDNSKMKKAIEFLRTLKETVPGV